MKKYIKELLPYVVIIIIVILIRTFIVTPVVVDGTSMNKTLNDGDLLLLYKLGDVHRNDIIVLKEKLKANNKEEIIIKRIIGLPGETVEIKENVIYINDEKYDDAHAYGIIDKNYKTTLSDDEYYILGDNRVVSNDSRYFGPIKKDNIMGKAVFRLFPFTKIGTI